MGRLALVFLVLMCSQIVGAIGEAPLGIYGHVRENGVGVADVSVIVKGLVGGEVVSEAPVVQTIEEGEFYTLLTVKSGAVVDVEITVEGQTEVIEGIHPWDDYTVEIELASEEIIESTTPSQTSAPTSSQFDEDYALIESGEITQELIDRYSIEIEEWQPYEPVVEEPRVVEDYDSVKEVLVPFYENIGWQLAGIVLVIICIIIIRHEIKLHRE